MSIEKQQMANPENREHIRKLARKNYAINRNERRSNRKKWVADNHALVRESYHNWEKRNPEKARAWTIVKRLIPLKSACEICGGADRLQRHHKDYGKPLEVLTLCEVCHNALEAIEPPICSKQPEIRFYKGFEPVEVLDKPRIKVGQKWPCRVIATGEIKDILCGHLCYLPHKIKKKQNQR